MQCMFGKDQQIVPGQNHIYGYLNSFEFSRKYYNNMEPEESIPVSYLENLFR